MIGHTTWHCAHFVLKILAPLPESPSGASEKVDIASTYQQSPSRCLLILWPQFDCAWSTVLPDVMLEQLGCALPAVTRSMGARVIPLLKQSPRRSRHPARFRHCAGIVDVVMDNSHISDDHRIVLHESCHPILEPTARTTLVVGQAYNLPLAAPVM